jgi:cardiolipin synthase
LDRVKITCRALLACLFALTGCSTLTNRSVAYPPSVFVDPSVSIESHGEPLDAKTSERVIERVAGGNADKADQLQRFLSVEERITGKPLVAGNKLTLLVDGPAAYAEMYKAIRAAKHHIHLETFIFSDDDVGQKFAQLLLDKNKQGVEVRVIYDAFGSANTSNAFLDRLKDSGIEVHEFNPINPLKGPLWKMDNRDHRKILVVDGRVGFTGGMNVSGVYATGSFSAPGSDEDEKPSLEVGWRDTHVRIDGPAVADLQHLFLKQWAEENADDIPQDKAQKYFPHPTPKGNDLVRIIASDGGDEKYEIYEAYLTAIEHATECIWVTQAYFAPNDEMLGALKDAAKRGVDVRILVPGLTDTPIILNASRAEYAKLLKAGIRIFERKDAMVHAKTAVVDGVWSTVGSSNFDYMSFLHNSEANAVIVSREFGRQMQQLYEFDEQHAREINRKHWKHRPLLARAVEHLSRLFTYWI